MKTTINRFFIFLSALVLLGACKKDEDKIIMNANVKLVITLSSQNVVLTKENADKDALTVSWAKPDYGFTPGVKYSVLIDKKGGDFSNAMAVETGTDLSKTFKNAELNALLLKLGLPAGAAADIDVRVVSAIGDASSVTKVTSAVSTIKATPYLDKLDLSSIWGIVGSAAANGWDGPDMPFYKTDKDNVFAAYVTLKEGEIKFRQNNKWDVNYGDTGADNTLDNGGDNIKVKAGTYKITLDLNVLKYTIQTYSWGLVGSAAANGWDGPDMPLVYDPTTNFWKAVVYLNTGEIKIRQNNDWTVNFGDTGANGTLDAGGDNIKVTKGTYLITVDFATSKFTLEAFVTWGLVGSAAPNGWDGPDAKFRPDFSHDGVWILDNVVLKTGEIKFRFNDKWDLNYGDKGADGTLEAGTDNIPVTAGTYAVILDLSNASKLTYKLSKK